MTDRTDDMEMTPAEAREVILDRCEADYELDEAVCIHLQEETARMARLIDKALEMSDLLADWKAGRRHSFRRSNARCDRRPG
jgi:hypothetical protein